MAVSPVYQAIVARQERQKEFYQGLEDAAKAREIAAAKSVLLGAAAFVAIRAYQRYHGAR